MKVTEEGSRKRITWDRNDARDVAEARDFFTKLTRQGWLAATREGTFKRALDFKPEYSELWFIPISEGG